MFGHAFKGQPSGQVLLRRFRTGGGRLYDLEYLLDDAKPDKLAENPKLYKTPIVRNGRQATIGYCPDIWKNWE